MAQPGQTATDPSGFGPFFDRRFYDEVTPQVARVDIGRFVNAYLVDARSNDEGQRSWVLVDTGTPGSAEQIQRAAEARYGPEGAHPEAIILTHGHDDHSGSARALAETWNVPIYAHERERPFLDGRSAYPAPDPTVGGALAFVSRFMSGGRIDVGPRLETLPAGGRVPGLPGWEWIATPGHAPGHVALFDPETRTLLAGDALTTSDQDRWSNLALRRRRLARAPTPFTPDWPAAQQSTRRLAERSPRVVAAGHGLPMHAASLPSATLADELERLAEAPMAVLLASGRADHATGATIDLNAGSYMR